MPKNEHARGISSSEPPATPEAPAGSERGDNTEKDRRGESDLHPHRMRHSQGEDGDGDRRTVHVDGRSERYADRIEILVQPHTLAQGHVDGYISR